MNLYKNITKMSVCRQLLYDALGGTGDMLQRISYCNCIIRNVVFMKSLFGKIFNVSYYSFHFIIQLKGLSQRPLLMPKRLLQLQHCVKVKLNW